MFIAYNIWRDGLCIVGCIVCQITHSQGTIHVYTYIPRNRTCIPPIFIINIVGKPMIIAGWWFGTCFIFPFSWECHHPNWRTHIFQRGRYTTNQIHIFHRFTLLDEKTHQKFTLSVQVVPFAPRFYARVGRSAAVGLRNALFGLLEDINGDTPGVDWLWG